ncbi:MAG: 50S ribosomal protein L20, partial [bacterium]
ILKENGLSYSKFMGAMKKAKIEINRKMLCELLENHQLNCL